MAKSGYFTPGTFAFLKKLARNNRRDWFTENKAQYEEHVKLPALRFIQDFAPHLAKLSPHFHAGPRSLFRIHRDTRFASDKSPYKTHTGIQFRHDRGRDVHAPGFYFHIEPEASFVGLGLWHPDGPTLRKIRETMFEHPDAWKKASRARAFTGRFKMAGDRLSRPPRGFDPEHPLIEDAKWKDFIGTTEVDQELVTSPHLPRELARIYKAGTGFMAFLCAAVEVPF